MKRAFLFLFLLVVFFSKAAVVLADDAVISSDKQFLISEDLTVAKFNPFLSEVVQARQNKVRLVLDADDNIKQTSQYDKFLIWINMSLPVVPYFDDDLSGEIKQGDYSGVKGTYTIAANVNSGVSALLENGEFQLLNSGNNKIFAYMFYNDEKAIITVGNLDFAKGYAIKLKLKKINLKKYKILPINISAMPYVKGRKIFMDIDAGGVNILILKKITS